MDIMEFSNDNANDQLVHTQVQDVKPKKFMLNGRNLFLTYPQHTGKKEELLAYLLDRLAPYDIQYVVCAQEEHEDGRPHLHAFVSLTKRVCFKLSNCLDFQNKHGSYELAKSCIHSIDYVKKDGNFIEHGIFKTSGDKIADAIRERKDKNEILIQNDLTKLVDSGHISLTQYASLKKCKNQYEVDKFDVKTDGLRNVRALWIYGKSGKGKSWLSTKLTKGDYYAKLRNEWWDGYTNHQSVVMNDLDLYNVSLGGSLKDWGDIHPIPIQVKGGMIPARWTTFIVTSQYSIEQIFGKDEETVDALKRRYTEIHITNNRDPFGNLILEYRWALKRSEPNIDVKAVENTLERFYDKNEINEDAK